MDASVNSYVMKHSRKQRMSCVLLFRFLDCALLFLSGTPGALGAQRRCALEQQARAGMFYSMSDNVVKCVFAISWRGFYSLVKIIRLVFDIYGLFTK